jgi:xanthine dehydrogenase accessory factor
MEWRNAGKQVALATVIRTWGSSPRPAGSHLVVTDDGYFIGSVSGGCIEAAVIEEARDVMNDGRPRTLEFGISDELAWDTGLACGGSVRVYVEPIENTELVSALLELRAKRNPAVLVTRLSDGCQSLVSEKTILGSLAPSSPRIEEIREYLNVEDSVSIDWSGEQYFLRSYPAPFRLVIIGAVQIAQVLSRMAMLMGFDVCVVDPRRAFATTERFPDVPVWVDWPDEALPMLTLDRRSAVIALSHDPKLDDPTLSMAMDSECFYIGALGSARTHARRKERLFAAGYEEKVGRIFSPIGLPLGGRSSAEIAVAILAQIVQQRHQVSHNDFR